ncbi:ExbD/TolR family protein [Portibacter marinus]|uniref:ExbD/TolR family protein n=1 Tax=Portibacter marinus TaxID=2898660 RepID=UPI001F2BB4ED|nr:biopolymer transporter ExbD [Portibacter marinus]
MARRKPPEINASSMADIAFLLLIFFLVTTTIVEDKGVLVRLPPWSDEPPENLKMNTRNVYSVLVNAENQLLVRGEPASLETLKENTKIFISNPQRLENMAEDPKKAIVSLRNDRGTNYETYLTVYNELKAAYNELRDEMANRRHGKDFEFLTRDQQRVIASELPLVISEAEPTNFGEEQ